MNTIGTAKQHVRAILTKSGMSNETAAFESDVLVKQVCQTKDGAALYWDTPIDSTQMSKLEVMAQKRSKGEPLQYICGSWEFYGLEFSVGKGVLIPRQDTETLVETVLDLRNGAAKTKLLDLCSGTGCIPIAIAHHLSGVTGVCVELSSEALPFLQQNLIQHRAQLEIVQSDVLAPPKVLTAQRFDVITCNPPYLTKTDMQHLQREVQFEPEMALYGGTDGLDFYRQLIPLWTPCLVPDGWLVFEVGKGQAMAVESLLCQAGMRACRMIPDLAGIVRVVAAQKSSDRHVCV